MFNKTKFDRNKASKTSHSKVIKDASKAKVNPVSKKDKDIASLENFSDSHPSKTIEGIFIIKGKKLKVDVQPGVLNHSPAIGLVSLRANIGGKSFTIPFCTVTEESVFIWDGVWEEAIKIGISSKKINALKNEVAKLWCKKVVLIALADKTAKKETALKAKRDRTAKFAKQLPEPK